MRAVIVSFVLSLLLACDQRETAVKPVSVEVVPSPVSGPSETRLAGQENRYPPVLNLSLPAELVTGDTDKWSGVVAGRYQTEEWFDTVSGKTDKRLKIKSKLLLKEDRGGAAISAFADAINGAEIGFEYKTP